MTTPKRTIAAAVLAMSTAAVVAWMPFGEPAAAPRAEAAGASRPAAPQEIPVVVADLGEVDALLADERYLEARRLLAGRLAEAGERSDREAEVRRRLAAIHEVTFFSPRPIPGDPYTDVYVVQAGDSLQRIARRLDLGVEWPLLQRINRLREAGHIRYGQRLKVVKGPFHARVSKHDFRLDLYAGPPDEQERWLYVRSFPVGTGEEGTTPIGRFLVKPGGKAVDPFWTDPRTGAWYAPGDPANPIGDRWIGLEGVGEFAALYGYGLHGTVEPESIGEARSLGCVRLLPDDVHLLYELLTEGRSQVLIEP